MRKIRLLAAAILLSAVLCVSALAGHTKPGNEFCPGDGNPCSVCGEVLLGMRIDEGEHTKSAPPVVGGDVILDVLVRSFIRSYLGLRF